ncbi:MAG: hypothetical protein ACFE0Q_15335 [Anaerolineae bacterium]
MVYHGTTIRRVIERLNLPSLKYIAQQPGIQDVFRVIVHYVDGRAYDSVSTLVYEVGRDNAHLETIYAGFYDNQPIKRQIARTRYQQFITVLQRAKFDTLYFPNDTLLHTATVWAIERATASFSHLLILTPHCNQPPYCEIINAVDGYITEAIREIPQ